MKTCQALILIILLAPSASLSTICQTFSENHSDNVLIRSGVKAAAGYSKLHLSDELRPFYVTNENYPLGPDFCVKVGAMITLQSRLISERLEFIFDPAFAKYSYGNLEHIQHGDYINAADVDVEAIELPLSLKYNFMRQDRKIRPFIRAGFSFSYFVDTEADFLSLDLANGGDKLYDQGNFSFSKFQDAISICTGVELNLKLMDFMLELVLEKGDGIHSGKFGNSYLKNSNTASTYLQMAVLF